MTLRTDTQEIYRLLVLVLMKLCVVDDVDVLVWVDVEVYLALDVVVDVDEVGFYGMGSFVHDVPSQPPSPPPLLKSSGQWDAESRGHYPSFVFFGILLFRNGVFVSSKTFRFKGKVSQSLLETKALNNLEFYRFLSFVIFRFKRDLFLK